jgi:hypothetical protein
MVFYTYLWLRDDGTPYYAGKGCGDRAFVKRTHRLHPPKNKENILIQEWPTEAGALEGEKLLISIYGRKDLGTGCLLNMTDGGDGITGYRFSAAVKDRCAEAARKPRRPLTKKHKAKLRALRLGKPLTEEHKKKIVQSLLGNQRARGKHWRWHANIAS